MYMYSLQYHTVQCNYQVSDEVVHDVKNYPDQGQCYLHKAEVDNID